MASCTKRTPLEEIESLAKMTPLQKIAGLAYDMELQIADAIGIARTAQEHAMREHYEDYDAFFGLILYRLEQIREGHALIAEHAPYSDSFTGKKERLS